MQVRYKKSNQLGYPAMLSSNNAQGLDPLKPFVAQQHSINAVHYSDEILKSVLSVNELDHRNQFHPQIMNQHHPIITNDPFLGSQPLDLRWPHQYHHSQNNMECPSTGEIVSPCHVGGDVADVISARVEKKRRCLDDSREKSIERKHKRMIKNRESAARSRARKQAHTKQLEEKVSRLQETNNWLKLKIVETRALSRENVPQKIQLRRSNSATF